MSEKTGKIISYNAANKMGEIAFAGFDVPARFYLSVVTNPTPEPVKGDQVSFAAADPVKNKKGKYSPVTASTVTITERSPVREEEKKFDATAQSFRTTLQRGARNDRSRNNRTKSASKISQQAQELRVIPKRQLSLRIAHDATPLPRDMRRRMVNWGTANPAFLLAKGISWKHAENNEFERNRDHFRHFMHKTFLPVYQNAVKNLIPLEALKTRQIQIYKSLRTQGYLLDHRVLKLSTPLVLGQNASSLLRQISVVTDHLYGYPVVHGSMIKGTFKEYLQNLLAGDPGLAVARDFEQIFGTTEAPGRVIFFDSFPTRALPDLGFETLQDSFPAWYHGRGSAADTQLPERDYLSVIKPGAEYTFSFALRPGSEESLLGTVGNLLQQMLVEFGLGSRTALGYGRFRVN
ncbi:type III-B CRISPR module RAMP protein Cmr6 [bacterium]|nr:type III-B CRISPR module RAMP protein Cmr6 [bacterium]